MDHFAQAVDSPVAVQISGYGPTDSRYFSPADDSGSEQKHAVIRHEIGNGKGHIIFLFSVPLQSRGRCNGQDDCDPGSASVPGEHGGDLAYRPVIAASAKRGIVLVCSGGSMAALQPYEPTHLHTP